jgi:gliding motility-associated lipoprotein GldH
VYRKAKPQDIDKWKEAQNLEVSSMYKARTIALQLGLQMKLSDVEYQGDKSKAIFYYTADERVDFRELIKVLAEEFRVRIEMRQIGARQEAARLGAIGACGRELCCSTWLTDFRTVSTSAARYQQLSLNPLKLAGQCGKLKCCLNYELDSYLDVLKEFPQVDNKRLSTQKGEAFLQKTDIFRKTMWWSYTSEKDVFIPLKIDRVKEILALNEKGEKPDDLEVAKEKSSVFVKQPDFENVVGQDSLTRFDARKNHNRNKHHRKPGDSSNKNKATQKTQGPSKPKANNKTVHRIINSDEISQVEMINQNRLRLKSIFRFICFALLVGLSSCNKDVLYSQYHEFTNNEWYSKDKAVFEFAIDDAKTLYDVNLKVRHADGYPYSNLFLFVTTHYPDGKITKDTMECALSNNKGEWLGEGAGDIFDLSLPIKKSVLFPLNGKYVISFEQAMRSDPLPLMMDLGLEIKKSKSL